MTPFNLLLKLSGLSQREASTFLLASPSSIDKWARGVRTAPDGVLDEMRVLIRKQSEFVNEFIDFIGQQKPDHIELEYPVDEHEAKFLGWPCVGAWKGMAARIIADGALPVSLIPLNSASKR